MIRADQVEAEQIKWLWQDRIPLGAITILAGPPGLGKSLLTVWLAAQLSRGKLGDVGPASVVLSSAEDARAQVIVPRLIAAGAEMGRIHIAQASDGGFDTVPVLPDDIGELAVRTANAGARLVVLDPLMAHLAPGINSWKDQEIRRALLPLKGLAEETGAAVVVVAHLNKGQSTDPLQRLGGSIGLPAAARSVLLLGRDPDGRCGSEGDLRVLAQAKNNIGPKAPSLALRVVDVELPSGGVGKMAPEGYSPHTAEDLLREGEPRGGSKRAVAIELLRERLAGGPILAREIQNDASGLQISPTTLERARRELGVISTKSDYVGGWLWSLPTPYGADPTRASETADA